MGVNEIMQIGSRIKETRKSKGLTQKQMSELLGIPYSTYSNYENNNREPSIELVDKIAEVLGVTRPELLYDKEKIKAELDLQDKIIEKIQKYEHKKAKEYEKLYYKISELVDGLGYNTSEYEEQTEDFEDVLVYIDDDEGKEVLSIHQAIFVELGKKMLADIEKYKEMRARYFLKELEDEESLPLY
jgi:transcriptional regulator with XRE-family HTH domain